MYTKLQVNDVAVNKWMYQLTDTLIISLSSDLSVFPSLIGVTHCNLGTDLVHVGIPELLLPLVGPSLWHQIGLWVQIEGNVAVPYYLA